MPGPNGISGNTPYIINLSDPRIVGNVGEVQPGGATPRIEAQPGAGTQAPAFREPVRAADVAGQLDVLLLKAAKGSAGEVDVKAVASAAENAKLPKATRRELESLAKKARASLAELDKFTGKDLAKAMEKKSYGTIGWKDGSMAASSAAYVWT